MSDTNISITASVSEATTPVAEQLAGMDDVMLKAAETDAADYVLEGRIAVVRTSAADFVLAVTDKSLFERCVRLREEYGHVVLIVEGELADQPHPIHPDALRGAISFLAVVCGLSVVPSRTERNTAAMLRIMGKHAQPDNDHSFRGKAPTSTRLYAEYMVQGLPGVGPATARSLLRHLGSARAVLSATAEELEAVPGLGPKRSAAIAQALGAPYPGAVLDTASAEAGTDTAAETSTDTE